MAIYRNEELTTGNYITIPCYSDFTGHAIGMFKIKKVSKAGMGHFNELETSDGHSYHLREFLDFSNYKDICGE